MFCGFHSDGDEVSHSSLSKSKTLDEIENWEELPGMDKVGAGASQSLELQAQARQASRQVIHKAQALKMDRPLRNLQDLRLGSAFGVSGSPLSSPWSM